MNYVSVDTSTVDAPQLIGSLRKLVPARTLTKPQTTLVTELQALRLRELLKITTPQFPHQKLLALGGIEIVFDFSIPFSGSAHWNGRKWVIVINAHEPERRQRFSLLHELKHVIDHTTKHHLYGAAGSQANISYSETIADYFAACVLMPEHFVRELLDERVTEVSQLAGRFEVSPHAIRVRLRALNLQTIKMK